MPPTRVVARLKPRERGATPVPPAEQPDAEKLLGPEEKQLAVLLLLTVAVAFLFPFKPVKFVLAAVMGIVYLRHLVARPDLALAIFVLALPLIDLLPAQILPVPGLNPQTILVVSLLVRMLQEPPDPKAGGNPFIPGLVLFTLAVLVGVVITVFSHGYLLSELLQRAKNHLIVIPVLFFVARVIKTDKQKRIVLLAMALLLFLISAHTIWDTRDQIAHGLLLERHRAVGLVAGQANLYGGWLALMVLGTICFCFSPVPRGKTRLWLAATAVMGSVALVYTLSRGAWLALAMALAVVAVLRNRRILFLGTLIVIFLPALASQAVRDRAASIMEVIQSIDDEPEDPFNETEEDVSAMVRVQQWQALPGMFAEAPLLGHGYAYFPELWQETGHKKKAAHSSIIEITVELGLFGLLGYAALVFPMILLGWRNSRPDLPPLDRTLGTAAFGMGLCLVLLDTSGTRFRNSEVMANFWVLAGMMVAVRNARSVATPTRPTPGLSRKALPPRP